MPNPRFVVLLAVLFMGACGGTSPTAPTPALPPGVNPAQSLSEVYEFPEGLLSTNIKQPDGTFRQRIPAGCVKIELIKIDPGRGSLLVPELRVDVVTAVSVCAEAPNQPKGGGFKIAYDLVDEDGNQVTPWLGLLGQQVMPGSRGGHSLATKVYMALPIRMPYLRMRLRDEGGNPIRIGSGGPSDPELAVKALMDWRSQ